tara:strand:- start:1536 stop:2819 length:1284 start_codon:yes stop_codon:yes gene_type:complete
MRTELDEPLHGRRLLVAVSGSIAAVKTPLLVSALVKAGAEVRCLITPSAERLVSPVALACLSRHRCYRDEDQWDPSSTRPLHIELAEWAELVIVAPLSATSLARWSHGFADGLLASTLLACECPILAAIAMNTAMWQNAVVQTNWQVLRGLPGVIPLEPTPGLLACDRLGDGRMLAPELIQLAAASVFSCGDGSPQQHQDWCGRRLLVSAGPTLESIDAARVLSNRSSGKMGVLLAQVARFRGAKVDLVHGPLQVPSEWLEGLQSVDVSSASEMGAELSKRQVDVDAIAMVAAVADLTRRDGGLKHKPAKADLSLTLGEGWQEVPDLLQDLARTRPDGQSLLGFAALTGSDDDLLERGEQKRLKKGCDLLMVNPIDRAGQGFGQNANGGWLLSDDRPVRLPVMSKLALAHHLLDALGRHQAARSVES